jgi:restriction-modification enzyme MmeI-like protein
MVLAQELRNVLRRTVQQLRGILTGDLTETLEGIYGVHRDGRFEPYAALPALKDEHERETRDLLERILPATPTSKGEKQQFEESFDAVLRSLAFTHLNRLVAFKLMEDPSRKVLKETVGRGPESRAFKFYLADRPAEESLCKTGHQDEAYRRFLLWQCAQLDKDIGVLFDPGDLASRVFPRPPALKEVLDNLNAPELAPIWAHEEAIGWVYQYYTPKDLREKARKESAAPRNSYEMAFRNQFYTPEYVVRFLVDNTLGRIWYEMRRGETALKDRCEYLALQQGEEPKGRPKKDPRAIRVLDPACGSGHFLVYAFVLFETIYREAYEDPELGPALRRDWPDQTEYERAVPKLIVENNLYGIDIDRRAVQLAALTLFLRARSRSPEARIETSGIVCAEPMPGETGQFEEFKQRELPRLTSGQVVVGRVLDALRGHLTLAAEAGSLLQAERELERLVTQEHEAWRRQRKPGTTDFLFPEMRQPRQTALDFEDVTDEEFWRGLERTVRRLLEGYAQEASGAEGAHRRLFARDGVDVLRFLDVLRLRYDVVLMNPPFGDTTVGTREVLEDQLAVNGRDIGASFAAAGSRWSPGGYVGFVLSTPPMFKPSFAKWRTANLYGELHGLRLAAHLGGDVLDEATVSASALVLGPTTPGAKATFFRLIRSQDKEADLSRCLESLRAGRSDGLTYEAPLESFSRLRGNPLAYWISDDLRSRLGALPAFEGTGGTVKQGTASADEFRFCRAWWEVDPSTIPLTWTPYTKTSEYSPYYDDVTWLLKFEDGGAEIRATGKARVQGTRYFGRPGVTYTSKAVLGFNPRAQPAGCAFGHTGSVAFAAEQRPEVLLGYLGSRPVEYVISLVIGSLQGEAGFHPNHYEVGVVAAVPWPGLSDDAARRLTTAGQEAASQALELSRLDETSHHFIAPVAIGQPSIEAASRTRRNREREAIVRITAARDASDSVAAAALGFSQSDIEEMNREFASRIPPASGKWRPTFDAPPDPPDARGAAVDLISYAFGAAFGRWDVRLVAGAARGERVDPFAAPPQGAPGMLARPGKAVDGGPTRESYPLRAAGDGIMVDDEDHSDDVVGHVRRALEVLYEKQAPEFELELCRILGIKHLRDYFRSARGFFEEHITRYSKGRRKAPLYWLLQSPRGLYSVWLYYCALDKDTLPKLLGPRYLAAKVQRIKGDIEELRPGGEQRRDLTKKEERRLADLEDLLSDVEEFASRIRGVVEHMNDRGQIVVYAPNQNDGVVLGAAPLHALIRWPKRRKHRGRTVTELQAYWEKLQEGEYDWSHLAMLYWPTRVTEKSRKDKSVALAHGLDTDFFPGLRDELRRQAEASSAIEDVATEDDLTDDEQDEE